MDYDKLGGGESKELFKIAGISEKAGDQLGLGQLQGKVAGTSSDRKKVIEFWKDVPKADIVRLRAWYKEDFDAFGYSIDGYFKKFGLTHKKPS